MNKTAESGHNLVSGDVSILVETLTQHEENKKEQTDVQHSDNSWQVALLADDPKGSTISPQCNLKGRFKKPHGKNHRNVLKTIKLLWDRQKSEVFIQTLPSLTKWVLGPFLMYGMNTRSLFVKLQAFHNPVHMESPVFLAHHFIKTPEFHESDMPKVKSSALVPCSNYYQQLLNLLKGEVDADVLSPSHQNRQLKSQQKYEAESFRDWLENHINMKHGSSQNTEESLPDGRCAAAASDLMLCTEVPEDLTQNGTQECAEVLKSQTKAESMQMIDMLGEDQGGSTQPEGSDPVQEEEEPIMNAAALQPFDQNPTAPAQCEEKIQSSGHFIPPEDGASIVRETCQDSWADVALANEEAMQDDTYVDHQVMQVPFLQYSDQSKAAFYLEITQAQIRSHHPMPADVNCTMEEADLMSEEETIGTQPFEPSETSLNDVGVNNEMENDNTSVFQFNEITKVFISEATRSKSMEKVQEFPKLGCSQNLTLRPSSMTILKPLKEITNMLPGENGQVKAMTIKSFEDGYAIDPLINAQKEENGHCPQKYDILLGQKTGEVGQCTEMTATGVYEQIMQAGSRSWIQTEMETIESFMQFVGKQNVTPCLDNNQAQRHNDQNFSTAATTSDGRMKEEGADVPDNPHRMAVKDSEVEVAAVPNTAAVHGSTLNDGNITKEMQTSLPGLDCTSDSSQKQNNLTKKAPAEVKNGMELDAEQKHKRDHNISKMKSNASQETLSKPNADKHAVDSSAKTTSVQVPAFSVTPASLPLNLPLQRCMPHEMGAAPVENEASVQPPLSFIPTSTAVTETSPFAGRPTQKFVYMPLHSCSYPSPTAGTDQTVPSDEDIEGSSSAAETTLYKENGLQDGLRRTDGYFKWKYVPSARTDDDEVMRMEENNDSMQSVRPCDMNSRRPRRIGLSRRQSVRRLHKSAHQPS